MALDLSKVELPDFEVTIENDTLVRLAFAVIVTTLIILLMVKATKRI